jgi:putative acetyltransferase
VLLSLVATLNGRIVGHVLYTAVSIDEVTGAGLGPMAVLPDHQRQGIGVRLAEAGNQRLGVAGCPFVVVVGHPGYYPRFGFRPASARRITCEWDLPDDVFMLLVLDEARMRGVSGLARYRLEFSEAVR